MILKQIEQIEPIQSSERVKTFTVSMIAAAIGDSTLPFYTFQITHMQDLDHSLSFLLASAPIIAAVLNQIPMTHFLNNGTHGVRKVVLTSYTPAVVGASLAAITSMLTDITKIPTVNGAYVSMFTAGLLIGMGSGLYPLTMLAQQYATSKHLALTQSAFGALVAIPSIVLPIAFYYLYQSGIDFSVVYSGYAALLAISFMLSAFLLRETPYQQLRELFDPENAKTKAIQLGQLEKLIPNEVQLTFSDLTKEYVKTLCTLQAIVLLMAGAVVYGGGALYTSTIFPSVLKNIGFSTIDSLLISGASIVVYIISRMSSAKVMDKVGRANMFCIGSLVGGVATMLMAFLNLPLEALIPLVLLLNIGYGLSLSPIGMLIYDWDKPVNKQFKEYDSSVMMGLFFSIGTVGQVIFSIISGGLIDAYGEAGIQYYFMLMLASLAASAIAVKTLDHCIATPERNSINCFGLFGNRSQANNENLNDNDNSTALLPSCSV